MSIFACLARCFCGNLFGTTARIKKEPWRNAERRCYRYRGSAEDLSAVRVRRGRASVVHPRQACRLLRRDPGLLSGTGVRRPNRSPTGSIWIWSFPPAGGFLLQRCKRNQKIAGGVAAYENTSAVPRVFPCPPPDPLLRGTHDWLRGSAPPPGRRGQSLSGRFPSPARCRSTQSNRSGRPLVLSAPGAVGLCRCGAVSVRKPRGLRTTATTAEARRALKPVGAGANFIEPSGRAIWFEDHSRGFPRRQQLPEKQ